MNPPFQSRSTTDWAPVLPMEHRIRPSSVTQSARSSSTVAAVLAFHEGAYQRRVCLNPVVARLSKACRRAVIVERSELPITWCATGIGVLVHALVGTRFQIRGDGTRGRGGGRHACLRGRRLESVNRWVWRTPRRRAYGAIGREALKKCIAARHGQKATVTSLGVCIRAAE